MPVYALGDRVPQIDPTAFVHPDAVVIGDVRIGPESTVWPTAVLRGDHGSITVGARTSVQDGTVVHCTQVAPTTIGDRCVVGHNAHLEGCTIEDDCLVGSGSVVLHRVVVRRGALVGAGTSMSLGTRAPAPTSAPRRTTTRCSTTDPDPTRQSSSIVQPSRCALWPTTHRSPIMVGAACVQCTTVPSCTDVRAPTVMVPWSPRSTAVGQTVDSGPMRTSPITTASGWTNAVGSIRGTRSPRA